MLPESYISEFKDKMINAGMLYDQPGERFSINDPEAEPGQGQLCHKGEAALENRPPPTECPF